MKDYLVILDDMDNRGLALKIKAKNDVEALVKAIFDETLNIEKLVESFDNNIYLVKDFIDSNAGCLLAGVLLNETFDDKEDYEDTMVAEISLLFNITDNKVVYGTVEDFTDR